MIKLLAKMRHREKLMTLAAIAAILAQIYFDLRLPDFMSDLTVLLKTPGSTPSEIWEVGIKMLGCTLGSAVFWVLAAFLSARVAAGFSFEIRRVLFGHVLELRAAELNDISIPSLVNRTTNDLTQIQMFVAMGLMMMVKSPVMAVWAVIKILGKNLTLSLLTGGFVVALVLSSVLVMRTVLPKFRLVQKLTDQLNRVARENLSGLPVVMAFNAGDYQNEKFAGPNHKLKETQLFNQRMFALMQPLMQFGMNALSLSLFWVGAALIEALGSADLPGRITLFSNVVVFSTYATYVVMSFMMLVMIFMLLPGAEVSAGRINEVLEKEPSLKEGSAETGTAPAGTVEFRGVSFTYPGAHGEQLADISFEAKPGETVAFIGATGSGKTSLVNLLARFYDPTKGLVLLDGRPLPEYTFTALYNKLGFMTQQAQLFSGSVADNISLGETAGPRPGPAEMARALNLAEAGFILEREEGLDTPVAQAGKNFSGGQKQRLAIARALARKPEVLVFDDSFSALDYATDAKLRHNLAKELSGVTKLVVAQRISTIKEADLILVLDKGRVVGKGRHRELLLSCPIYREIALSQLSPEELEANGVKGTDPAQDALETAVSL